MDAEAPPEACCGLCASTWGCVAFTHYEGRCYLKEEAVNVVSCEGCSSGVLTAPSPNATLPRKWEMAGMTFTGGRYCPNISIASAPANASLHRLASTGATWVPASCMSLAPNLSTRMRP